MSLAYPSSMFNQENMSVRCKPPYTPLSYRKTGVCRGITIFLIFAQNIDCGYTLESPRKTQIVDTR